MRIIEGEIGVVGAPVGRVHGPTGGALVSVLEIGGLHLDRVLLPDDLRRPLLPGKRARMLVGRGLTQGMLVRPFVAAVEVDGTKYRAGSMLRGSLLEALGFGVAALLVCLGGSPAIGGLAGLLIGAYYLKDFLDLRSF